MRLSQICIDRPVLSIVMSLVILVFGFISFGRLTNRELPDIDRPIVSVVTILPARHPLASAGSKSESIDTNQYGRYPKNVRMSRLAWS